MDAGEGGADLEKRIQLVQFFFTDFVRSFLRYSVIVYFGEKHLDRIYAGMLMFYIDSVSLAIYERGTNYT